jgi:hypothetical protein
MHHIAPQKIVDWQQNSGAKMSIYYSPVPMADHLQQKY